MRKNTPEKRARNAKFLATERRLTNGLLAKLRRGRSVSVRPCEVYRGAVTKSSFFNHFTGVDEVLIQEEERLVKELTEKAERMRERGVNIEQLMSVLTIFVYQQRAILAVELKNGDISLMRKLIGVMRADLIKIWANYNDALMRKIFQIYEMEIISVVDEWRKAGFIKTEIDVYLRKMIALTRHADQRLAKLVQGSEQAEIRLKIG